MHQIHTDHQYLRRPFHRHELDWYLRNNILCVGIDGIHMIDHRGLKVTWTYRRLHRCRRRVLRRLEMGDAENSKFGANIGRVEGHGRHAKNGRNVNDMAGALRITIG